MQDRGWEAFEAVLGHRFADRQLLERALTHRSCRAEQQSCAHNEQLEFLGDAVLSLILSVFLIRRFPDWSEGELSRARGRLASAAALAEAARRIGLGQRLRLGPGEEKSGGREKGKLLANAYEAVTGAIFLDGGLAAAEAFVERTLLLPELVETAELARTDHKSALQEWLQARRHPPAQYRVLSESGPEHAKLFEVAVMVGDRPLAVSTGRSKKEAEQRAAALALEQLRQHSEDEQRFDD
jgi:ribonuclease-3